MHASPDQRIAAIASGQHGAVTRDQLHAAGLCDSSIALRVRNGRLHRVHRGVYLVGHRAMSRTTRWMAAVLAGGEGTYLDLHDAAELHDIARPSWRYRRRRSVAVISKRQHRPARGIRFQRTRHLPPTHVTTIDGIPVVTIARLLVNLASSETPTTICKLIDEAAYHDRLDLPAVRRVAEEFRTGRSGYAIVMDGIARYDDGERGTDSELEEEGLRFTQSCGVPTPQCNLYLSTSDRRYRVDQCWRADRVIQEVNGGGHARPTRRREDLRRRRAFRKDGWTYLVVTRHDLRDPVARERAAGRLRRALGASARRNA